MSETLDLIKVCIARRAVRVSDHGADQVAADAISLADILMSAGQALVVEGYPEAVRGPSVLALHREHDGRPVHVYGPFAREPLNRRCW